MPDRLRFHLDEHIDPAIARALRRYGIDVTTTKEAGLRTKTDQEHLDFVQREKRVLVTYDPDFLRLSHDLDHPGIVFGPKTLPVGRIVRHLILMYELITPEEMRGRVEYL